MIFDVQSFGGEEALLDRDAPGTVMGVAVALQADGFSLGRLGHGLLLSRTGVLIARRLEGTQT